MHIFVTGATGWVGSAVVEDLLAAGHQVTGLARSADKAASLAAAGAKIIQATLDDLDTLRSVASTVDAVIHTAFNHDFSKFIENAEQDRFPAETFSQAAADAGDHLVRAGAVEPLGVGRAVEAVVITDVVAVRAGMAGHCSIPQSSKVERGRRGGDRGASASLLSSRRSSVSIRRSIALAERQRSSIIRSSSGISVFCFRHSVT